MLLDKAFSKTTLKEEANMKTLSASIEHYVKQFHPKTRIDWAIKPDEEHQAFKLRFDTKWDAIHSSIVFDENFVTTPEFRELQSLSPAILGLNGPAYRLRKKARRRVLVILTSWSILSSTLGRRGFRSSGTRASAK